MGQIDTTETFVNGQVVDAASLNNIIDQALALPGIIDSQPPESPQMGTSEVLVRTAAGDLRKRAISTFPSGVISVSMTATPTGVFNVTVGTPTTTPNIALTLDSQSTNKVLAAPDGSSGVPAFRKLAAGDLVIPTVLVSGSAIDWNLGFTFKKILSANTTFTFTNGSEGQTIKVLVVQDGTTSRTVTWPLVRWPGGVAHVMTVTHNALDLLEFSLIGGVFYGTYYLNMRS